MIADGHLTSIGFTAQRNPAFHYLSKPISSSIEQRVDTITGSYVELLPVCKVVYPCRYKAEQKTGGSGKYAQAQN